VKLLKIFMQISKNNFDILFFPLLFFPISIVVGQAAISITFLFSLVIFVIKFKLLKIKYNLQNISLFLFFISIFVGLIFKDYSSDFYFSQLKSSFLYLKFLIIYILIININIEKNFYSILKIIFFLSCCLMIFVIFDTLYQYFNPDKIDIFGYKATLDNQNRLTGPFGNDEAIPGSFLTKVSFVHLIFLNSFYLYNYNKFKIPIFIILLFVNLLYLFSIFFSGERMAFLMTILGLIIVLILDQKLRKYFLAVSILFFSITFLIVSNNNYLKERYIILSKFLFSQNYLSGDVIIKSKLSQSDYLKRNEINFFNNQWGAHYLTSIEIFKDNPLFGAGIKGFRKNCSNKKYENIKSLSYYKRCSSHPHNLYLEILSETGILGFGSIFLFLGTLLYKNIKLIFKLKKINFNDQNKILFSCYIGSLAILISLFWPIRSSGSFFSNLNGIMIWMNIFYVSLFYRYFKKNSMI
tara:strand:+ start:2450 stop:3847 length:1398 start_codon:yes stop_codon:yes gene_type:complete